MKTYTTLGLLLVSALFLAACKPTAIPPVAEPVIQKAEVLGGKTETDFLSGGIASADTIEGLNVVDNAVDNNNDTFWNSSSSTYPHWWKYDLGDGVTKTAREVYVRSSSNQLRDWKLQGSNNDSDWTDLLSRSEAMGASPVTVEFENDTAYRYYRVYFTSSYLKQYNNIFEVELFK